MKEIEAVTQGGNLAAFLLVLVALVTLFILFGNAVKMWRDLKKPQNAISRDLAARIDECEERIDFLEDALRTHEKRINRADEGFAMQCAALRALLEHELHNGNSDEMQKASDDLFNFLNRK